MTREICLFACSHSYFSSSSCCNLEFPNSERKGVFEAEVSVAFYAAEICKQYLACDLLALLSFSRFLKVVICFSPWQVLLNAFAILDTEGRGMIPVREFCAKLSSVGFSRYDFFRCPFITIIS